MMVNRVPLDKKEDVRGWLVENESSKVRDQMRHFLVSSSKPNAIRGQHYHKRKTEWFLVLTGKAEIFFKDIDSLEEQSIRIDSSNPEIIEISPRVAHSIKNVGKVDMLLLGIATEPLDRNDPDTFPYKVI